MLQIPSFVYTTLLLIAATGSVARLSTQTEMAQQQVVFDDSKNEAAAPAKKTYNEAAKSWYAVYNTAGSLHVYLAVTDPQQQEKIIMNGIQLWIDARGKRNKKTGILYPFVSTINKTSPSLPDMNRPLNFNNGRHDIANIKALETMVDAYHEMQLTGFKEDLNGVQNSHHPSGIHVSMYFIKDTLFYEAQLPLNTLPEAPVLNSHISVGIIEKGMPLPGFNGNGGMLPPDGGGPGGDGMMPPPGGPAPGGEEGMRIFEDDIIWYKLSLQDIVFVR